MGVPKKVLLVDDEESVRESCAEVLASAGYDVDVAVNGYDGMEKIGARDYDILVVDINMPRLDGIDFYREATRKHPGLLKRFLFITGDLYGEQEALEVFLKADKKVLKKPFTISDLLGRVSQTIESASGP